MQRFFEKIRLRLPALALLALTVLFWSLYDRYEPAGPVLLASPSLADGEGVRGDVAESGGRFTLRVPRGGKTARVNFPLPAATNYATLRACGRVKVDGVVVGKYPWSCARLLLAQYDARNRWIPGEHQLLSEHGTSGWIADCDEFEMQTNAARATLILIQAGKEGTAEFDRIGVRPVRIRPSFPWWRAAFAVAWLWMAVLYFPRCRLDRRRLRHLILLNAIAILFGVLMPADWIKDSSEWAKDGWARHVAAKREAAGKKAVAASKKVAAPTARKKTSSPRKKPKPGNGDTRQMDLFNEMVEDAHSLGHFVLFASLCLLVYLSAALERQRPSYFVKVAADVLLFAAITESLQFLTPDRTPGIGDLRIDIRGMAVALLLFLALLPLLRLSVRWRERRRIGSE